MKKPNIIALPTSQMHAFCDVLGLPKEVQFSKLTMIEVLEEANFDKLKKGVTHNFEPDVLPSGIVETRKAELGRV